ncbi:MAG: hypothetical protein R3C45_00010 [Phycisphaerales bacterium]
MQLETADRSYESIDDYTIAEAVRAVADLKTEFAILSLDDGSFMQTAGGTAGMVLEYRDNQAGGHFVASGEKLSAEDVIAAFESFASGDGAYKPAADWQPLKEKAAAGCGSAVLLLVALPVMAYLLG